MNQDPLGIFAIEAFLFTYWQLLIMIVLAPLIIQLVINLILGIPRSLTGIDFTPFVRLFAFPGTLFRIMLMYFTLGWLGWKVRVSHGMSVGTIPTSMGSGSYFRGFIISMTPANDRPLTVRDTIFIAIVSYLGFIFAMMWWDFRPILLPYLQAMFGYSTGRWLFYYLFFSFLIGGLPIPEETLLPVYYFIAKNPHIVLGILGHFIVAALIFGLTNMTLAMFYLYAALLFTVALTMVEREEFDKFDYMSLLHYQLVLADEEEELSEFQQNPSLPVI